MFGNNGRQRESENAVPRRGDLDGGAGFSIIGPDITIEGNLTAENDLHLDGNIDGDLRCASLVQAAGSTINGSVRADKARIGGVIEGSVVTGELIVEKTARIIGDISYDRISVEDGAEIDGQIHRKLAGEHSGDDTVAAITDARTGDASQISAQIAS